VDTCHMHMRPGGGPICMASDLPNLAHSAKWSRKPAKEGSILPTETLAPQMSQVRKQRRSHMVNSSFNRLPDPPG